MPRVSVRDRRRGIAIVTLAAIVVLTLIAWKRPNPVAHETTVRAAFTDASGLAPVGADVRIAGAVVGRVTGRERKGNLALVSMKIGRNAGVIHRDATAELRPRLLFEGTAYVSLSPGTPGSPELGDAVIPPSRTHSYVSLADALSIFDTPTQQSIRTDAHQLKETLSPAAQASLGRVLRTAPRLTRALRGTATAALGPHGDDLQRAVAGSERVATAVALQRRDLAPLARAAAKTAGALGASAGPASSLDRSIERLPQTVASVRSGAASLGDTLGRLRRLATTLQPAATQLTPTLDAVAPLLAEAKPVVAGARPLVGRIDTSLRGAHAGAQPALRVVAAAKPSVGVFANGLLDALERKTSLGTPAYLSFLGLFAGGGGASRPYTSAPAQGHFMRFGFRFLTGVGQPLPPCSLLAKANAEVAAAVANAGGCQP